MVRLTPELISRSPQFMNCLGDRELDLRGNQITLIENLATSNDQFDVLDLTGNLISDLSNLPRLVRLKTILAGNNRITRIGKGFTASVPSLQSLILTGNQIRSLNDVSELSKLGTLEKLSLTDNPVTKETHYRLYLIHKIPSLRSLDYQKVKAAERIDAKKLFSGEGGDELKKKIEQSMSAKPKTFAPGELGDDEQAQKKKPTPEQIAAVKTAIQNAKSMEEIAQLEKALRDGKIEEAVQLAGQT